MNHVLLMREPIDVGKLSNLVADKSGGAVSTFAWSNLESLNGPKIISLEYEAYEPMALKEMKAICAAARTRWCDIRHIAIHHRLGLVLLQEASVIIAISSLDRQPLFEAVAFVFAEIKRRVPIWKKENFKIDKSEWKANKECAWLNLTSSNILEAHKFEIVPKTSIDFIPEQLVQISAADEEVQRRISCFIKKKRDEINASNFKDFIQEQAQEKENLVEDFFSCARTNSFVVKQEYSKGHLRVRRADNTFGPQTRPNYAQELEKLMCEPGNCKPTFKYRQFSTKHKNILLDERVDNISEYVGVTNINSNHLSFADRIKELERRILYLESLSPEYRHFMVPDNEDCKELKTIGNCLQINSKKKIVTVEQLQDAINSLEENYQV